MVTKTPIAEIKPWDRFESDTDHQWEIFLFFRDNRPITHQLVGEHFGLKRQTIAEWASINLWSERCAAYDRHIDKARQRAAETAATRRGRKQQRAIDAALDVALRGLNGLVRDFKADLRPDVSPQALARLLREAVTLHRLVHGESTENVQVGGFDPTKLSEEELAQAITLAKKATPEG
jgi:hypothetical protein